MADKTAAELAADERAKIGVTMAPKEGETEKQVITPEADAEVEEEIEGEVEEEGEEAEVEGEEGEAEVEKTAEELAAEKEAADKTAAKDKIQRRIDREVAKRKDAERRLSEAEAKLSAKPDSEKVLTADDVQTEAKRLAEAEIAQRDFNNSCNRLADAAGKIDKDFQKKVKDMADDIGQIPGVMIGILDDLDNGGDVLSHLVNNTDEAETLYRLSPVKMGVQLAKLSNKLADAAKPKPKAVSRVPKPNEPLGGGSRSAVPALRDNMSMDEFVAVRNRQIAAKQGR